MKPIFVTFSKWADEDYRELQKAAEKERAKGITNSENIQLLRAIDRSIENLKINPQYGVHISKKYVPKKLEEKYGTHHLWKVNLPNSWRMIYTIVGSEIQILSLVLEIVDHKEYNKLFGYKKK